MSGVLEYATDMATTRPVVGEGGSWAPSETMDDRDTLMRPQRFAAENAGPSDRRASPGVASMRPQRFAADNHG